MMEVTDASLSQTNTQINHPIVFSAFIASESGAIPYTADWGDGGIETGILPTSGGDVDITTNRRSKLTGFREAFRIQHSYAVPGEYQVSVLVHHSTEPFSFAGTVVVETPSDRQKPLYRWTGPSLSLQDIKSHVLAVESDRATTAIPLIKDAKKGDLHIFLPPSVEIKPGDKFTISQNSRMISSGEAIQSNNVDLDSGRANQVSLSFDLNSDYEKNEALVVVTARDGSYVEYTTVAGEKQASIGRSYDEDVIKETVGLILATIPGERVMRPELGSRLHELVFDQLDGESSTLAQSYVFEAINSVEPRAMIINPSISQNEHEMRVSSGIAFQNGDQEPFSLLIPLQETVT